MSSFLPVMPRGALCLLGLMVLFAVGSSQAVDANCNYRVKLVPGNPYYIWNPNYKNSYYGARSCQWHIFSDTRVRITCIEFNIPASPLCAQDAFSVQKNPSEGPRKFCGNGDFTVESDGKEMIAAFTSSANTPGGKFRCYFEAIEQDECKCGWKNPTKIVGGVETGVNEYPMMVGVINVRHKQVYCGGTLISNRHVLTAAHCLNNLNNTDLGILVGDHDLYRADETTATRLYPVKYYTVHPQYTPIRKNNDIAVVTISGTVTYTNEVGPACLPFQHYLDSFGGAHVDVLGWGTTEFAGAPSNTLQKVDLSVTNFLSCKEEFTNLEYSQMCTYTKGKDACQFDSGGPILWRNPTTRRLVLVGIISYGTACANDMPAVNTRVGAFIDWILQATSGTQYCQGE